MRRNYWREYLAAAFLSAVWVAAARAQSPNFHRWSFEVGAGVTPTLGHTSDELGTGWNVIGGAGYNFNSRFGADLQVMYDGLGVNSSVLKEFSVPGANAHLWGFTLDPIVRFRTHHRLGFYITGGGGYYRRIVNFTRPTTAIVDVFDPFFGIIQPIVVPASQTIGTITRVGWGENIGGGFTYKLGDGHEKLFVEARYHHIETRPRSTDILPITVGIRW